MKNKSICPSCGDVSTLVIDTNDVYVGRINSKIWVNFYSYQCDGCEQSHLTEEIDENNSKQINIGISKFLRMRKIINLVK